MSQQYIISFDAGGTRLKVVVVDAEGQLIKTFNTPSNANKGADVLFDTIHFSVEKLKQEYGSDLLGIALSLSGVIHPHKGVVLLPGKFKMLEGYPIVEKLKTTFGVPVIADNDGRLAIYAEKYFGLAKDVDWAVALTIGTGIGSGVIIDGKILTNRFLQFGTQVGHIILNSASSKYCLTGNYGTGETLCSATALVLQVRGAIQRGIPSILSDEYFLNPAAIDFEKAIDACRKGDALCVREMENWSDNLATMIVNAIHAYSPEVVILSGGATLAADLFLEKIQHNVKKQVFCYPVNESVPILISKIQEYASALGAAIYLKNSLINQYQN
jgi:glucokinase